MAHPIGFIRRALDVSLGELSRVSGYSEATLSRIERQERRASPEARTKLLKALCRVISKNLREDDLFAS